MDQLGNPVGMVDLNDPLGELAEHAPIVELLLRLALQKRPGHLPHDDHERSRILVRDMEPQAGLAETGRAGNQAQTRLAGELAVGLRHDRRAGFVPAGDNSARITAVVEGVEQADVALARDAERKLDSIPEQRFHQRFGRGSHQVTDADSLRIARGPLRGIGECLSFVVIT